MMEAIRFVTFPELRTCKNIHTIGRLIYPCLYTIQAKSQKKCVHFGRSQGLMNDGIPFPQNCNQRKNTKM